MFQVGLGVVMAKQPKAKDANIETVAKCGQIARTHYSFSHQLFCEEKWELSAWNAFSSKDLLCSSAKIPVVCGIADSVSLESTSRHNHHVQTTTPPKQQNFPAPANWKKGQCDSKALNHFMNIYLCN